MPFTYIVECSDGSYYVGSTRNLERRIHEHNNSDHGPEYTKRRRPISLVWSGEFTTIAEAYTFEKQLQGWSRAKRRALVEGRIKDLPMLAAKRW